jgi:hypothetical protein
VNKYIPPVISEHFEELAPRILYHYTGQNGILGIIEHAELWATKIQYMNDSTEFGLALSLARAQLENLIHQQGKSDAETSKKVAYKQLLESLSGLDNINIFATCFCANGDLLSQWRGYTGGTQGYAIGFDSKILKQISESKGFTLGRCIYDVEVQRILVHQAIEYCIKEEVTWGHHWSAPLE